jgi:hypothetical protein
MFTSDSCLNHQLADIGFQHFGGFFRQHFGKPIRNCWNFESVLVTVYHLFQSFSVAGVACMCFRDSLYCLTGNLL